MENKIDFYLWSVQREIVHRHGCDAAERAMYPLAWYVYTGRGSATFLSLLLSARPVLIARDLMSGGSDDEIIDRVCKRIGYQRF